ncbi:MAG: HAMP domain-containing histidine kinase [Sandaracinus sp.]|nr:HAMP domain-containing histidine kinase [Sandaracinus sp.]MCB9616889.1 HAMP domain-containing histidine kinase [Sandaracinus sp.]
MRSPGLRLQLVLALTLAFVVAFSLLGIAAAQLGQRARAHARLEDAEVTASLAAASLARDGSREAFVALADAVLGRGDVRGMEWTRRGLDASWVRGVTGVGTAVSSRLDAGEVRLWLRPTDEALPATASLLLFYVALTGGVILLLSYLVLTFVIVRPVEAVTLASERVAGGNLEVSVPVRGAAEVARLATSFNAMAERVRHDRDALQERLRQLERTTAELASAQEQVVRGARLASVGRLAAGLAHEIGNPLAAILGLVELAQDADVDEADRAEMLQRIQHETERIHAILRDLLDFARQGAEMETEIGSADLRAVVADAAALVAPEGRGKLVIARDLADIGEVVGHADRLEQVVLNLLLNAKDAMGGTGTVHVRLRRDEGVAELVVRDEGPGIAPEILDRLFEPFVTTKPVGQGTGLGLAVCHTLVERLGGTITADNPTEGGACFVLRLPMA